MDVDQKWFAQHIESGLRLSSVDPEVCNTDEFAAFTRELARATTAALSAGSAARGAEGQDCRITSITIDCPWLGGAATTRAGNRSGGVALMRAPVDNGPTSTGGGGCWTVPATGCTVCVDWECSSGIA